MRLAIIGLTLVVGTSATLVLSTRAAADKGDPALADAAGTGLATSKSDKDRPRPDREPRPQIVFECLPVEILFNENDLILVCEEPLTIGDEIINTFSVRHNKRFSASAVTLYTTAMMNGQWLLMTVDETNPLRDRCLDGCRRVNQVSLAAPGSTR